MKEESNVMSLKNRCCEELHLFSLKLGAEKYRYLIFKLPQ